MKFNSKYIVFILIMILFLSGCNFSLLPEPENSLSPETSQPSPDPEKDPNSIPIVDGFDFPVGDRNANGWAVTGYDFLDWSNYSQTWHPGEDWNMDGSPMADLGQPVYSIANGIVLFSGWNSAQGNIVMIEHRFPDGVPVWSQYAHLEERWVSAGEIVDRRQQIGTVGRGPNNRFSPHLHFEIRRKYLPQNGWPRTNGQAWNQSQVYEYYLHPSDFINSNRPAE